MVAIVADRFPPGIQRLDVSAPPEDFIALLKRDGGVIIENYVPLDVVDQCNEEIRPELEREQSWHGEFFPVSLTYISRGIYGSAGSRNIVHD
jgi:hypothetical protein